MPATIDYVNERTISSADNLGQNFAWTNAFNHYQPSFFSRRTINNYDFSKFPISSIVYMELAKLHSSNQGLFKDYRIVNFSNLKQLFLAEIASYDNLNAKQALITEAFNSVVKHISKLKYEDVNVDITNSGNIKFSLLFKDRKILMINKSFDLDSDDNGKLIFYSFFIDKQLIASDVCEISTFVDGFSRYLDY